MKSIDISKFLKIKHKTLELEGKWRDTLGDISPTCQMLIYGKNGSGKTEFAMQLAKELSKHGRVEYVSYEQGWSKSLSNSGKRNFDESYRGKVKMNNPNSERDPNKSSVEELNEAMGKRKSARFWIIDSCDVCGMNRHDYEYLKKKYNNKMMIWLSYEAANEPKTSLAKHIAGDGDIKIRVQKFIATTASPHGKNRYEGGGYGQKDYIVYEERAKQLNKLYEDWAVPETVTRGKKQTKRPVKKKKQI